MKKQEIIQKAYGKSWDTVKDYVNENGFVDCVKNRKISLIPFFEISEIEFNGNLVRPKSLQGIEANNGWTKIEKFNESEMEEAFYWVIDSETNDITDRFFNKEDYGYFVQFSSHYQTIIKPKPPIY